MSIINKTFLHQNQVITISHDSIHVGASTVARCIRLVAGCRYEIGSLYLLSASMQQLNIKNFEFICNLSDLKEITNGVQIAYAEYLKFKIGFLSDDITSLDEITLGFEELKRVHLAVWQAVYIETQKINPSLKSDINNGKCGTDFTTSDLHFLDLNWQVFAKDYKCPQCGATNNHKV